MKPYLTILLDSFRMLKSKAIFWVTLGISILVALLYLSVGFNEQGVSLFFGAMQLESEFLQKGSPFAELLYLTIFTDWIAEYWLGWIAVLLGLVSCGAIFPDAMKEGSAGMILTKKPSRLSVFFAKFIGSLFFVAIQVLLFVGIVFLALKWRIGTWNPSVFWYVPLILLVFTYLYSFMVLIAVKTRSVMTALLFTLMLWGLSSFIGFIEGGLYTLSQYSAESVGLDTSIPAEQADSEITNSPTAPTALFGSDTAKQWHRYIKVAYGFLPKTGRTIEIADRLLVVNGEQGLLKGAAKNSTETFEREAAEMRSKIVNRHSVSYSIGTSLVFAAIMLSLAAWLFCRRDY